LDVEELLDRLPDLRLVRVLVDAKRVLPIGDERVALLRDDRCDEHLVRMQAHRPSPIPASAPAEPAPSLCGGSVEPTPLPALARRCGSAASLTGSERAQTTLATSGSAGTVTSTRSRLRKDFTSGSSSSAATTTTGSSCPQSASSCAAFLVEGASNWAPSTS